MISRELREREEAYERVKKGIESITYSDCLLAVRYDANILSKVPEELRTSELCLSAIKSGYASTKLFIHFPKALFNKEFAMSIVKSNGVFLKNLPLKIIDEDVIITAVNQNIQAIKYIPDHYKTDVVYKKLFDLNSKILKYIDNPSVLFCEYVIKKSPSSFKYFTNISILAPQILEEAIRYNWKNIKFVPKNKISKKLCKIAFEANWKSFQFFPNKFKTQELCNIVVNNDAAFLQYCPEKFVSETMLEKCLSKYGSLLEFVPEKFKTEKLCLLAIENDYNSIIYIPKTLYTREFLVKCLNKHLEIIYFIPDEIKNLELYKEILDLVSFSNNFTEYLKSYDANSCQNDDNKKYLLLESFVKHLTFDQADFSIIKRERELSLRTIHSSSYDGDIKQFVVTEKYFNENQSRYFSNFQDFYLYLDGNIFESNLTEYDFEGVDINKYNLDGAYLCSKILIEQGRYTGEFYEKAIANHSQEVSFLPSITNETVEACSITHADVYSDKLNLYDRKVYYITDIHLNHRLLEKFPKFATYDEIRFYIKKIVRKMLSSISGNSGFDYLLIGGDVSYCFDISSIFYKELCRFLNPSRIIVVLGNHELWDYNQFGDETPENSFEQTINKYQELFKKLGIVFLHNSLLVGKRKSRARSLVLTEKDILEKGVDELRNIALDSDFLLFGSLGFSGYNRNFNASHGIYRNTITSLEEDLIYTKRCESAYKKIQSAFGYDKVIVLSHTPLTDWTASEPISNWIYVNGHTHHNTCIISDNCKIYSDNQVGYKSKNFCLKYFKASLNYDIFKYHIDGIYKITKEQYLEFNQGNNISCSFSKNVDYILMLKREGIYLFLLEDQEKKRLYLLNGGITNRLKITDINYYYDNMIKYSEYIRMSMKTYNDALRKISADVKSIGGEGTIHGCIIDIDYYNHLFLDPNDGKVTAYYSPWYGYRKEYPSIEQLLENQLPQLYSNYNKMIGTSKSLITMSKANTSDEDVINIFDTSQYRSSRLIKHLQYLTENNVIRAWSDDLIFDKDQIDTEKPLLK